jgi:hypothetical protein
MVSNNLKNTPTFNDHEASAGPSIRDHDDLQLQRLGKKPVLKVREPLVHILDDGILLIILGRETSVFSPFWV